MSSRLEMCAPSCQGHLIAIKDLEMLSTRYMRISECGK